MAEYKLTYHKFPRFSTKEEHEKFEQMIHPPKKGDTSEDRDMITLGNFDRLTIEREPSFTRSRDFSLFSRGWHGDRLSLLLYDLGDVDALQKLGLLYDKVTQLCYFMSGLHRSFVVFTFFNLSDRLIPASYHAGKKLHKVMLGKLSELSNSLSIEYALMGCFGMADYCLVTLTDDYADALAMAEKLKAVQVEYNNQRLFLFSEFYTCVSLNRKHKPLNQLEHQAVLYIATKGVPSAEKFKQEMLDSMQKEVRNSFAEMDLQYVFGEYDLALKGEARQLIPLIEKDNPFHFSSKFYLKNVLRTQVQLLTTTSLDSEDTIIWDYPEGYVYIDENILNSLFQPIQNLIEGPQGLRSKLKKVFPPISCFVDDFDALYHDLRNYLFSTAKLQRRLDCAYRFRTALLLIQEKAEIILSAGTADEQTVIDAVMEARDNVRKLMDIMNTQLRQERSVTMLELDSPLCQSNFNGHQDMILHSYNNYLKELLVLLYKREDQPKLVPLVTSSTVFQILSNQYSGTVAGESVSLLHYELPTAVMTDLSFGLVSILHETFHYVPPSSREARNIHTACIFLCELTLRYYCDALSRHMMSDPTRIHTEEEENSLAKALYELCVNEEAFPEFVISVHQELVNRYESLFAKKNPNHYFAEYCNILCDVLMNITSPLDENFFSWCLKKTEHFFGEKFLEYDFIIEPNEISYHLQKEDLSVAQQFLSSLKADGNVTVNDRIALYREVLLDPYREIKADIGMLVVTRMDLTDYLLMYAENRLLVQGKIPKIPKCEYLRLFVVARFLDKNMTLEDLHGKKDEFVSRYIFRFLAKSSGGWSDEEKARKITEHYEALQQESCKSFDAFMAAYTEANQRFSPKPYQVLLDSIVELLSPRSNPGTQFTPTSEDLLTKTQGFFSSMRIAEKQNAGRIQWSTEYAYGHTRQRLSPESILRAGSSLEQYRNAELKSSLALIQAFQKSCLLVNVESEIQGGIAND